MITNGEAIAAEIRSLVAFLNEALADAEEEGLTVRICGSAGYLARPDDQTAPYFVIESISREEIL